MLACNTCSALGLTLVHAASEAGGPVRVSVILEILLIAHGSLCYFLVAFVHLHLLMHHVSLLVLCTLWPVYTPDSLRCLVSLAQTLLLVISFSEKDLGAKL